MGILDALDQSFAASGTSFSFGESSQQSSQQASGSKQSSIHEAFAAARAKQREDQGMDYGAFEFRAKRASFSELIEAQIPKATPTCR